MKSKTELNNRYLWYDGTVEVNPEFIPQLILRGMGLDSISATHTDHDVNIFNSLSETQILVGKNENSPLDFSWKIPDDYLKLDLETHVNHLLDESIKENKNLYVERVKQELFELRNRKLENLFKALVFLVDIFKNKKQVWGVGRGSSCASLILFLIGLHEVDPIKYKIPLEEFFHN